MLDVFRREHLVVTLPLLSLERIENNQPLVPPTLFYS